MKKAKISIAENILGREAKAETCKPESTKKRMRRCQADKQWLLDNQDKIFSLLDGYDSYYRALGYKEQQILELEAEKANT